MINSGSASTSSCCAHSSNICNYGARYVHINCAEFKNCFRTVYCHLLQLNIAKQPNPSNWKTRNNVWTRLKLFTYYLYLSLFWPMVKWPQDMIQCFNELAFGDWTTSYSAATLHFNPTLRNHISMDLNKVDMFHLEDLLSITNLKLRRYSSPPCFIFLATRPAVQDINGAVQTVAVLDRSKIGQEI